VEIITGFFQEYVGGNLIFTTTVSSDTLEMTPEQWLSQLMDAEIDCSEITDHI